jgi:urease gamma subunit
MEITPRERDKLLIVTAALLAERRMAREARGRDGVTLMLSFEDHRR